MNPKPEPKLAPPGAGLPALELFVGRLLFALRRATSTRNSINAQFQHEREKIRALIEKCDADSGACQVLIRRLPGLEDSSRFWSVWMTLDHLRIVNRAIAGVIESLTRGRLPDGTAGAAAVKPSPDVTSAVIGEYEQACEALLAAVAATSDLKTNLRYAHPWFGPLKAAGWHALSAGHMRIHRGQIVRILQGL
jgi:uncharacterized damage-inducible protein DinB